VGRGEGRGEREEGGKTEVTRATRVKGDKGDKSDKGKEVTNGKGERDRGMIRRNVKKKNTDCRGNLRVRRK
jgi:hypothetical protein